MSADQRRYQVFVSSTYADLREARQQVTMTLLECDAFPTGMEIFPATDDDAWTLIQRVIDESDYYLLVIAGKYGSVSPVSNLSYTEMEYDYAVSAGKPVMAFLHGNPGDLKADQCESSDARREQLANFREKVRKAKHVKFWKSPDELAGQVALTYNKFVRQYPATGWVRADRATSTESLKELVAANSRIQRLEDALKVAQTSAPAGTENLAQGDDTISVSYSLHAGYQTSQGFTKKATEWTSQPATWDGLFASIAPQLLQEAEEAALKEGVEKYLLSEFFPHNIDMATKAIKADRGKSSTAAVKRSDVKTLEIKLRRGEFETILVQLVALGLISRSERKRSVSNTGTYWALTKYGEIRTIQLRAQKKPSNTPTVGVDTDQTDGPDDGTDE